MKIERLGKIFRRLGFVKVLVTGSTGFVGRHVVGFLQRANHYVRAAGSSNPDPLSASALFVGCIGPDTDWTNALEGMDAVVHLAARAHVMRDRAGAASEFQHTNTEGTLQLARSAAQAGVRRFVFASTVKVHGEATTSRPFRADDVPQPCDPYAQSKLAAEIGLRTIDGLEPVIIRPPLVHGPGAKGNLARFCWLARSGLPVPFGSIDNRRDLVGVANLASLIERCLTHASAAGQIFLASDGEALSTPSLYRTIAHALGRPARILKVPVGMMRTVARPIGLSREVDRLTQSLELDITKTRHVLGWEPQVSAVAGVEEMARAFLAGP